MGANPMQKMKRNSILIGLIVGLIIGLILCAFLYLFLTSTAGTTAIGNGDIIEVYTLGRTVKSGENITGADIIGKKISKDNLQHIWKGDVRILLRNLHGVDMQLQKNKIVNLKIASKKIDGIIIKPGEEFSFWNFAYSLFNAKASLSPFATFCAKFSSGTPSNPALVN